MSDDGLSAAARAAASGLGRAALAELVGRAEDAVCVVDTDCRYLYANAAAGRLLARPAAELVGSSFLDAFADSDHASVRARLVGPAADNDVPFTAELRDADAATHDVVCSTSVIDLEGPRRTAVVLRDVTGPRAAARRAVALAQSAAQLVGSDTVNEMLSGIARHAFEGGQALAAAVIMMGDDHRLDSGGAYDGGGANFGRESASWAALNVGRGDKILESLAGGKITVGERPGNPVVLPDARSQWLADPASRPFARTLEWAEWRGAVCVPVAWDGRVIGVLEARFPPSVSGPSEDELAFYSALADQAAVAFTNARLARQLSAGAALQERARLAHELHDSVSQGLFSLTMHARAAQLAMVDLVEIDHPLARSLDQLVELTNTASSEMRSLVFELTPGLLTEQGLVGGLRQQAALLARRGELSVVIDAPDQRLRLAAAVEEHLYRIVTEALHNIVKHARVTEATVTIVDEPGHALAHDVAGTTLRIIVADAGDGFQQGAQQIGHMGMSTMAQRAEEVGATLEIRSQPGSGTVVEVSLPRASEAPSVYIDRRRLRGGRPEVVGTDSVDPVGD